jgi:hypothetical protein
MKSGPQRLPGASTAYWYQTRYGGDSMESNVIVWHTTEGTSLPSYAGGAEAPNFTAKPDFAAKRLTWFQHFDFDTSSRALVNLAGGVETNTLNVCQVEIVGTCDPSTHEKWRAAGYAHLYTPELPDWAIRDLAAFAKWAHDNHGVPLTSDVTFKAYPGSYGTSNGVRMSAAKWTAFTGHCGHQHVPENLHGDPGLLPMAAILTAAKGGTTTPPEDDMPTADEIAAAVVTKLITGGGVLENSDLTRVAKAVLTTDDLLAAPSDASDYATNKFWTLQTHVQDQTAKGRAALALLTAQKATIDELVKAVAQLAAGVGNLDPAAIVRELTAAIEAIDIHLDVPDA